MDIRPKALPYSTFYQPKFVLKYVSRVFKVMTVLNGTVDGKEDMGSSMAYEVKYSQLAVNNTKV